MLDAWAWIGLFAGDYSSRRIEAILSSSGRHERDGHARNSFRLK